MRDAWLFPPWLVTVVVERTVESSARETDSPRWLAFVAVVLVVSVFDVAHLRADGGGAQCAESVTRWVAEAAAGSGVVMRATSCDAHRVVVRIDAGAAEPLDVEIAESPVHTFRRIGEVGLAPMLEVHDWREVELARRAPFERLATWVEHHADRVVFGEANPMPALEPLTRVGIELRSPWLLLAALAACLAASRPRSASKQDVFTIAVLFASAALLRGIFGLFGPLHVNGQGPLWIAGVFDPSELTSYGGGYAELHAPLVHHLPFAPDWTIFGTGLVCSSLVPVLAFAWARSTGVDRVRATLGAAAIALDPVSIRVGATESYFPLLVALSLGASVVFVAGACAAVSRDGVRATCLLLSAGLLAAQAVRTHPAGWIPVALAPISVVAIDAGIPLVRRAALAALAALVGGVVTWLTSGATVTSVLAHVARGQLERPLPSLGVVGLVLVVGVALAALAERDARARVLVGVAHVLALVMLRDVYAQSDAWRSCFDRLYLAVPIVVAASLLPERLARARRFLPLALVAMVALAAFVVPSVYRERTTEQLEYAWVRPFFVHVPDTCRVVYVSRAANRVLRLPTYLGHRRAPGSILALDGGRSNDAPAILGELGCTYYVQTSLCSSREGRGACEDFQRQLELREVSRASLPARPSYTALLYDRARVRVAVARVVGYRPN